MTYKHKFLTLDGIRGLAAVFVVIRHMPEYFGGVSFPHSYLAVDLFFVMSGFVISRAYDKNLVSGKLSVPSFLKIRGIRLYPLYALALIFALGGNILQSAMGALGLHSSKSHQGHFSWIELLIQLLFGLLLVPCPIPKSNVLLFPLNLTSWSVFLEVIINWFYATYRKWLTNNVCCVVLGVSAATLGISVMLMGNMDIGSSWGNGIGGFPRVFYSFTAGLLIARIRDKLQFATRFTNLGALMVLSFVVLLLGTAITSYTQLYDLVIVLLIFPILILAASFVEPSLNSRLAGIFGAMGQASYAIYILQISVIWVCSFIFVKYRNTTMIPGVLTIIILVAASLLIDRYYDQPVRRWLKDKYLPPSPASQ